MLGLKYRSNKVYICIKYGSCCLTYIFPLVFIFSMILMIVCGLFILGSYTQVTGSTLYGGQ